MANSNYVTMTANKEKNGIELRFDEKPDATTISTLKSNHFLWHPKKGVWYTKDTPEARKVAKMILGGKSVPAPKASLTVDEVTKFFKPKSVDISNPKSSEVQCVFYDARTGVMTIVTK